MQYSYQYNSNNLVQAIVRSGGDILADSQVIGAEHNDDILGTVYDPVDKTFFTPKKDADGLPYLVNGKYEKDNTKSPISVTTV